MRLSNFSFPSLHPHTHSTFFTSIYMLCPTPTHTHAHTHAYAQPYTHTHTHSPHFSHPHCPGKAGGGDAVTFQLLLHGPTTSGLLPRAHPTPATLSFSCPKQIASALGQHCRSGAAWKAGPGPGAGVCRSRPHLAEAVPAQGDVGRAGC